MSKAPGSQRSGRGSVGAIFLLVPGWLAACALGGVLAGLSLSQPFLGWLFLFGLAVGAAQAVFVWRWWGQGVGSWIAGSFGGWSIGSLAGAFTAPVSPLVEILPWVFLSLGQLPVLNALLRTVDATARAALMAAWIVASAIGGILFSVVATPTQDTGLFSALETALGETASTAVLQTGFTAVLYGIPTAVALSGVHYVVRNTTASAERVNGPTA